MKKDKVRFITVSTGELGNNLSAYVHKLKNNFVLANLLPLEILSSMQGLRNLIKKALLFSAILNLTHLSFSQNTDSTELINHFGGAVTVTNNGISLLPNLSLDKPAVIFDVSMGRRLSFFLMQAQQKTFTSLQ